MLKFDDNVIVDAQYYSFISIQIKLQVLTRRILFSASDKNRRPFFSFPHPNTKREKSGAEEYHGTRQSKLSGR